MKTIALIDADILVYMAAFHVQESFVWDEEEPTVIADEEAAIATLNSLVDEIKEDVKADHVIMCLSCPTPEGWRRKVLDSYKSNRANTPPPVLRQFLADYVKEAYESAFMDSFEGDDMMGLLATHPYLVKGHKVICSSDKDMKTVQGDHYDFKNKERFFVGEEEASYWHMFQTLTGDSTDGYKGCPRVGKVKAEKILTACEPSEYWEAVVQAFEERGLSEDDALVQARVARICHASDIDLENEEVILWEPPKKDSESDTLSGTKS